MSDAAAPRRQRFPLRLDDAQPKVKRFVSAPGEPPLRTGTTAANRLLAQPHRTALEALPRVSSLDRPSIVSPSAQPTSPQPAPAPEPVSAGTYPLGGARLAMIERLRRDGCTDPVVLQAMAVVPRHLFLDPALQSQAYEDTSLPIGLGQTISKPSVVARMLALLRQRTGASPLVRALEIGTGCGYQAAVLSLMARQVYSVERLRGLYDKARDNLAPMRSDSLRLIFGDGRHGHAPNGPYDVIIAAAGGEHIPPAWLEQLAPGGRLVAPVLTTSRAEQVLVVIDRLPDGQLVRAEHEAVRFVPLESGVCTGTSSGAS